MTWDFELIDGPYGGTTEGPAWDGRGLLFTHIPGSRIMRYDPQTGASTVFRSDTNWANGLMLDPKGVLFGCEGAARATLMLPSVVSPHPSTSRASSETGPALT